MKQQRSRIGIAFGKAESGFTLIELLVATAIIGVLSGIALTGFTLYKDSAYRKTADSMMHQARTALEAGKQDIETFPDSLEVNTQTPGPLTTAEGQMLLPGLVLPERFWFYAYHDSTCGDETCMEDYIVARSCKTNVRDVYFRTHGGLETVEYNVEDTSPC